jgi:F-type H+-transporting ATPase subunit alpha
VEDVRRFEAEFLDYVARNNNGIYETIRETGKISDDTLTTLKDAIAEFKKGFETSSGELLVKDEPVEALEDEDVKQEKITRRVKK